MEYNHCSLDETLSKNKVIDCGELTIADDFSREGDLGLDSASEEGELDDFDTLGGIAKRFQRFRMTPTASTSSREGCMWDTASETELDEHIRLSTVIGCLRRMFHSEPCLSGILRGDVQNVERSMYGYLDRGRDCNSRCYSLDEEITEKCRGDRNNTALEAHQVQYRDDVESEITVCRELLKAKYKAANILLKQLAEANDDKYRQYMDTKLRCEVLVNELNRLQFELHSKDDRVMQNQEEWFRKLSALEEENASMKRLLAQNQRIIKSLTYENQVLKREREELLSLMDVKERQSYVRSSLCIQAGPDDHNQNTTTSINTTTSPCSDSCLEIAMLAACRCRGADQEPCTCAKAVAYKQHLLDETISQMKQQEMELIRARRTADIYQEAFEMQLGRNRELMRELSLLKNGKDVLTRFSASIAWTAKQRKERHIIQTLVDSLCEKNEALEHQQIMVKLLAQQLQLQQVISDDVIK